MKDEGESDGKADVILNESRLETAAILIKKLRMKDVWGCGLEWSLRYTRLRGPINN